jgi:hypothetical protein
MTELEAAAPDREQQQLQPEPEVGRQLRARQAAARRVAQVDLVGRRVRRVARVAHALHAFSR